MGQKECPRRSTVEMQGFVDVSVVKSGNEWLASPKSEAHNVYFMRPAPVQEYLEHLAEKEQKDTEVLDQEMDDQDPDDFMTLLDTAEALLSNIDTLELANKKETFQEIQQMQSEMNKQIKADKVPAEVLAETSKRRRGVSRQIRCIAMDLRR